MSIQNCSVTDTEEWKALQDHWNEMVGIHTRALFDHDASRFEKMSLENS